MTRTDVVVVGAGLAGLSCALELTSRGREVLLLEAGQVVGGRTSSIAGLTLAGDYTCQQYLATMEGAVVSGQLAADAVVAARRPVDYPAWPVQS
jgi:uncharacterized protein with NAD-binding domain and iron-sulfur cluster